MPINTTTIAPAVIKAKNVATESYVDTEIASVDISGQLPTVVESTLAPSGSYPINTIWRREVTKTIAGVPSAVDAISNWKHIGGSNIVTGSINTS